MRMPPLRRHLAARSLPGALLLAASLAGCGSEPAAPQPFADVAGTYMLRTVNDRPLPWNSGGNTWLFERRLVLWPAGRFERFDVYCHAVGEECPRRESAISGAMERAGDGTLILRVSSASQWMGGTDTTGALVFIESLTTSGTSAQVEFRFGQR